MDLITVVNAFSPSYDSIKLEIEELKKSYPKKSKMELAEIYGNRIKKKYASVGFVSALPSAIPGVGTGAQIAIELTTVSGDLALMMRWMASTSYGIGLIYEKNIESEFNQEFVRILGLWCGVIKLSKSVTTKQLTKVAVVQFNKKVSGKMIQNLNRKIGTTIFTKYGTKRGGIALGRLVPLGVGAIVGGTFNYFTMSRFKKSAIEYFKTDEETEFIIIE